jgi:hypothetical protein
MDVGQCDQMRWKKVAQNVAQPIFVKNNAYFNRGRNVAQKYGPLLLFSKIAQRGTRGQKPLCLSFSSALHFSDYSFWVHHLVNRNDRQLLAHEMASDFSNFGQS